MPRYAACTFPNPDLRTLAQVFKSAFSDIEALPTPEPVEPRTPAALMHALATYTSLFTHSPW